MRNWKDKAQSEVRGQRSEVRGQRSEVRSQRLFLKPQNSNLKLIIAVEHQNEALDLEKINVMQKFSLFDEHWQPKVIAELNGQAVKLAKVRGGFIWHHHDNEDELFYVLKGKLTMKLRDRDVVLNEGEMFVVPRGVEHKPVADDEVWMMLFEPMQTLNTGNVHNERTVKDLEKI